MKEFNLRQFITEGKIYEAQSHTGGVDFGDAYKNTPIDDGDDKNDEAYEIVDHLYNMINIGNDVNQEELQDDMEEAGVNKKDLLKNIEKEWDDDSIVIKIKNLLSSYDLDNSFDYKEKFDTGYKTGVFTNTHHEEVDADYLKGILDISNSEEDFIRKVAVGINQDGDVNTTPENEQAIIDFYNNFNEKSESLNEAKEIMDAEVVDAKSTMDSLIGDDLKINLIDSGTDIMAILSKEGYKTEDIFDYINVVLTSNV